MSLTTDQQKIANDIFKIMIEGKHNSIILSGPAGTGKTYLVHHILTEVLDKYKKTCKLLGLKPRFNHEYRDPFIITATTNKAVSVLKQSVLNIVDNVTTIESALGLVVSGDMDKGKYTLKPNPRKGLTTYDDQIIIIDEASMIDKELYMYIEKCCENCFIIYVGDDCQLPAVRGGICPTVFTLGLPEFKLTTLVRQANNTDLIRISNIMRNTVYTKQFQKIKQNKSIHWYPDPKDQEAILKSITMRDPVKILTYTNKKSIQYNDYILKNLYGDQYLLVPHETYITNNFVKLGKNQTIPAESEIKINQICETEEFPFEDATCKFIRFSAYTSIGEKYLLTPEDPAYFLNWLKYIAKYKDWPSYFYYKESIVDLRGQYSCTIHKSQGSTFNTVIIDADDFKYCTNPEIAARLLYVAVSRAQEKIIFFGNLPQKYGEFI